MISVTSIFKKRIPAMFFFAGMLLFLMVGVNKTGWGQTQTFSSNGTFTVPVGVTSITVECWGGGGGGGTVTSGYTGGAGGGGGGAYASSVLTVTPGNTYAIVVGSGGASITDGSSSTFSSTLVVAAGGSGALLNYLNAGAGGTTANSTGTVKYAGGNGAAGVGNNSGGGGGGAGSNGDGGNASGTVAGTGTASYGGTGGAGRTAENNGINGSVYGGGGSGAVRTTGADKYGGYGANGFVVISWPALSVVPATLNFGFVTSGSTSAELTYALSGENLTGAPGNISVTAPSNFEVSLTSGSGFGSSVSVPYAGSTLVATTLYVRFKPTAPNTNYSGNISNSGGGSVTKNVAVTGNSFLTYCTASALCDEYIERVQVGSIDNTTLCTSGGYADYTVQVSNAVIGIGYPITITNGNPYTSDQCGIWIDWNKDGDFGDANETISVTVNPGIGPYTATITPPAGATIGNTRMRVRIVYTGTLSPCGSAINGETEDYTLNVLPNFISTGTISGSPFCAGVAVSVPFSITQTFTSGNVFTAQLSDATGSFASPVDIGILNQTTSGTIPGIIPAGTSDGTGYRIRVKGSTPATEGTDNGSNLTINALPTSVTITPAIATICNGIIQDLTASGGLFATFPVLVNDDFETFPSANFSASGTAITAATNSIYYSSGSKSVRITNGITSTTTASTTNSYQLQSNIDLTAYSAAKLTFSHICALEAWSATYDAGYVGYSTDGGATWTTFPTSSYAGSGALITTINSVTVSGAIFSTKSYPDWAAVFTTGSSIPGTGPATSLWKTETINIPSAALSSSQFRIRFQIVNDASTVYYGWLIDNVSISGTATGSLFTWTPITGLYTDAPATIPYTAGLVIPKVYAKPSATSTYTATSTSGTGCTRAGSAVVTVNPTANAGTISGTSPLCISGTATYTTTGSGGSWSSSNAAVATVIAGTGAVTALSAGTSNITYTASSGCGSPVSASKILTVNPNNSLTLTSAVGTNAQTKCINTAITNITYSTTGATGATVTNLPTGVTGSWAANVVTISGTPTVAGAALTYTVILTGGCGTITTTGTITVTANNTLTLTSAVGTNAQTKCINTAITNITYSTTGATGATITNLPTGILGSWAANVVTISGTPTVAGAALTYTVTLTGGCGTITATGSIAVYLIPSAPVTTGSLICIGSTATLSASGAAAGDKYKWYDAASGGTLLKTSTDNADNTYATPVLPATTNYWVSILNAGGCESSRTLVTATFPSVSPDNQNSAGTNSWIGHVYDGLNFDLGYYGNYTETESFDQNFGGDNVCFSVSFSLGTRSIYTDNFSVRYRMNSTKRGLYVVNLGSDDGSRLTVDGIQICNNWTDQSFASRPSVLMNLNGASSLVYDFYEKGGQNRVVFNTLTQVLANNINTNITQNICLGSTGSAISGDVYGTLPAGVTLSGTGYQWAYSTASSAGPWTDIAGETAVTYLPVTGAAAFTIAGTYYIIRKAVLSSVNNVLPNPYVATNESNAATITINVLPVATFSYTGTPYCQNASNPSPTYSGGGVAGTFSSTGGLVFVSTATGQVNLAASTAGTYTVTNTIAASGGCGIVTATSYITITTLPAATISYSGNPFCKSSSPVSVTRTGTAGGAYSSSPAGLTIDAGTGAITPGTSTAGAYTVTYSIAAANGCGIVTATAPVTITAVPTATISYAGTPFCTSVVTAQSVTLSGTGAYTGGTYAASPAGLTINSGSGDITPGTSTAGTYTVTYTIPASGGCAALPATTPVTITTLPVATFSYTGTPYCQNASNPSPTFSGGGVAGTFSSTAGLNFVSTATGQINLATSTAGTYTVTNTIAASGGCAQVSATSSITITTLPTATISYAGSPWFISSGIQNVTLVGTSGGTYSALAGLSINGSTGAITPGTSTAGTYTVTYTIAAANGCSIVTATTSVTILDIINVSGSTGANGGYASLTNAGGAFAAINATAQTGKNVVITISGSSTSEAGTNSLNAGVWTTLSIYPTTAELTISGSVAGPLIHLNGADNVTLDGRVNQTGSTKSLTITNTNTGGAVIQFKTDASANTIRYCFIQGVTTSAASGLIVFSTGTTTGNDNNNIEYCDIMDGATTPTNSIYSAGTSVAVDNSGISISNCNIYNYFNAAAASNGIFIASNSSAWSITGNKFFQTATRTSITGATHRAINIVTASGVGYTVNNNSIGFANNASTGITSYDGTTANLYRAIELTVGASPVSNLQGNTIAGISLSTSSGSTTLPGIFSAISILAGNVNAGTTSGNTIGASTGNGSILITSTTSLGVITGIYATSTLTVSIQNNTIGSANTTGDALIGYSVYGIYTAGTGSFTLSSNTIGSATTANSITAGADGITTTPVCTFNGISNTATGTISITGNTVQNCSSFGTAASVYNGIINSGIAGTVDISTNTLMSGKNTGTGTSTAVSNSAAVATLNINSNIIRSHTRTTASSAAITVISNTGAVTTTININSNQLGNASGGLITYTAANSGALTGISNTAGANTCALSIQNNDIRGIVHAVTGSSVHKYIANTAATLSQNISNNTFTNLSVNTTGSVTFITVSNALSATGVQTVSANSIVTGFSKTGAGGTITFCSGSGTSTSGSSITQNSNNFSNVTATGATVITGWSNTNTSLNKTFNTNTFSNWTGGSAAVTAMSVTAGASTISANTISNISTSTAAAAAITAISSGATGAISITDNVISGLVTGSAAFINSFTGITNVAGNNVTITGNSITGCTAGGTLASIYIGITTKTAGIGTLTITGNSIISGTNAGTGAFTAISNSVAFGTIDINNNIIRNHIKPVATGAFTAIANSGAAPTAININYNQLGNAAGGLITYNVATAIALLGISNTGGSATCALTIQNNDIRGIVHSVAGTNAHTYIINSAATLSQNISSNTFTGLSVKSTGAIIFIANNVTMPANGIQNVNGNSIVTSFTRTAASGDLTLFTSTASTALSNVTVNNNNNNFSNITISGTATISGWVNTDAGAGNVTKTLDGNTFNNWTAGTGTGAITAMNVNITSPNNATKNNTISNISSAGTITGITTTAGNDNIFLNTIQTLVSTGTVATIVNGIAIKGGTTKQIYRNTICNLQANKITTGSVSGIAISSGLSNTIFRNKIYNISSANAGITTGTVNGILVSGAVASQVTTIHNNRVGDLRATAANVVNPVRGISIANTGLTSTTNVYYNTVYLNAASSGTNFGSTGIYHAASITATTATLDLRNNIIVNLSTPKGTGYTVVYRRSAGTANMLNNYATTSNNNLFYSGTPGTYRLIYADGTSNTQELDAYKAATYPSGTIAPRDQASVTGNPLFLSITGSDADFLKINTTAPTYIESGALNIATFTSDFDGDIRAGNPGYPAQLNGFGTAPDIGADEFDGSKPIVVVSNADAGSNGDYTNLGNAFAAINAHVQTGKNILVTIVGNTTETTTATLNAGVWTTLTVLPSVAGFTVTGNIDAAPVIDLNGADHVTLDGRVGGTGTVSNLIIANTSASATAGNSTIRFSNSAENNTAKYCNIRGSSTSAVDGIILFSTSASGNGNDNNVIEFCNITNSGSNRPVNAIYSLGSSGFENSGNTISNNTIYDFFNTGASSNGINIGSYSTAWTMTGNSFYETASFAPTASCEYDAIRINNTSGVNFTVSGNYIGGRLASCGGSAWTVVSAVANPFYGIYLNVGTTTASSIQNNIIKNFNYTSDGAWVGIRINDGSADIGTTIANTIGGETGTGSVTATLIAGNLNFMGIDVRGSGTINIENNHIGSVTTIGSADHPYNIYGIYSSSGSGTRTILNNLIGSIGTANSIQATGHATTSSTPQYVDGIFSSSGGTSTISGNTIANMYNAYDKPISIYGNIAGIVTSDGVNTIQNNTVRNLSTTSPNTSADYSASVIGISQTSASAGQTVSGNTIYDLTNTHSSANAVSVIGLYYAGSASGANTVSENFIHSLSLSSGSTSSTIAGIRAAAGVTTYSNNIINLGAGITSGYIIYGIYENGAASNNNNLYFNTVYIGGAPSGTTSSTYALYNAANTNARDFRNNIFHNARSGGSAGKHYAVYLTGNAGLTINYNDYYTSGTSGVLGNYNGVDKTTLPDWQNATGQDGNSLNVNPGFATAGGTNAVDYKLNAQLNGVTGTGILLDYDFVSRGTPPNMGAWEFNTNRWKGTISTDFATAGNWTSLVVPIAGASIVFDDSPVRDCYLDGPRTVHNITNIQSTYKLVVNGEKLTIKGNLYFTNGAQIDARATNSEVVFAGTVVQIIPNSALMDNQIYDLTINTIYGVSLQSDLTVIGTLNLQSANPSDILGCLETGTKTLTLGGSATTIGQGDVTGIVRRTTIVANTTYTFGNKFVNIYFPAVGTLPSALSVKISLGAAPAWKPGAIERIYEIIQTGADPLNPTSASITSAYLDSELNGNIEDSLVFWSFRFGVNSMFEHGKADQNTAENWVRLTNVNMAFFSSGFGAVQVTMDQSELDSLTWNGSVSTSWTTVNNWTPNGAPSEHVRIIIPDASTTPNDPVLPPLTSIKTLKIKSGGILNSITGAQATIKGGAGAWSNTGGTFNPGNSTVVFSNALATITGSTAFNNVTINNEAELRMTDGCYMGIAGAMNNIGPWHTVIDGTTTVEYNGGNQTVVIPNPASNRYPTLTLSGSGTKTMPASAMAIYGDFSLLGTVTVTALNDLEIRDALSVGSQATFITGAYSHSIGGDFTHDGTFTTTGSAITFNGLSPQIINGSSSATLFNNLTILSAAGVTGSKNISVNGILNLQSDNPTDLKGSLDMGSNTLLMGASATTTGTGDVTGIVRRTAISADTPYTLGNSFTTLKFDPVGTLPSEVSIKITIGSAPSWKPTAIKRTYEFIQTGGSNCYAEMSVHYLDSELNANTEDNLVYWAIFGYPVPVAVEIGRHDNDALNNWVSGRQTPVAMWPSTFMNMQMTLAESENPIITWNGTISTDWMAAGNWTPKAIPNKFSEVIIPDAGSTPNNPLLPEFASICDLTLENGAVLNAGTATQFNIYNLEGGEGWHNLGGTFNPEQSSVVFINRGSLITGTTNFYNVTILAGADLTPQTGTIMRIAGTLSNNDTLHATRYSNTIEYNGADQTVIIPNGTLPGYHSLALSGSGTKTLPGEALDIHGDFSMSGTATTTAVDVINASGNFSIGFGATFIGGTHTHAVGGNWTNSGTFTATGSTIDFNGASASTIGASNFNHITISGAGTKTATGSITAAGNFYLTSGRFNLNNSTSNTISISGNYTQTGGVFDFNIGTSGTSTMSLGGNLVHTTGAGSMTTGGTGAPNGVITFNGSGIQTLSITTPGGAIGVKYSVPSGKIVQLLSDITLNRANGVTEVPRQGEILVNGTFDFGIFTITQAGGVSGTAVFTVNSGAYLITANAGGISGSVSQINMTTAYSNGADYEFQGASTGTFTTTPIANTVNNLIINYSSFVVLTNSLTVAATLSLTNGKFTLGANTLTIAGTTPVRTSGTIDAANEGATLAFTNPAAIILPASVFTGNVNNLTINGAGGITMINDLEINGILNLQSANPSATKGSLDMWDGSVMKTLTMGADATTVGAGDVTGIVKRTTLIAGISYSFGNQYSTISFMSSGILPADVSVKITIGTAPSWKTGAVQRTYDWIQTGGSDSYATVIVHYLDSELNGNTENMMVWWACDTPFTPGTEVEYGRSNFNVTNNWVAISGVPISLWPTSFAQKVETLGTSLLTNAIWNGSISTDWVTAGNWTPNGVPSDLSDIVIPDAATTPNDPISNLTLTVGRMIIESAGILNSSTASMVTISGAGGAWINNGGTFNAGSSTVIFTNEAASVSGETNFYNVTINSGAVLLMEADGTMRIGGTMTNNGTWRVAVMENNTVEYNGGSQTVLNPNAPIPGYHNLILSGSGTKTMPGSALAVAGFFSMSGTATATAGGAMAIKEGFNIGSGTSFTTAAFNHSIGGSISNNGTFTATGSTITCTGTSAQMIGGTTATSFNDLTIANTAGVTLTSNTLTTVSGVLTINEGKKLTVVPGKRLSVTGTIINNADASGFVLQSDATGTASLLHNTNNVPATVQRYITGAAEAWHFLSSPVGAQSISGSWLPGGTYGNGTGYDLYLWNEPTNCWIYKLNTTSLVNWDTVHPGADFMIGRGYLYSTQAANPTKAFAGNLNNGTVNSNLTFSSADINLKGFNLVGNPYPSSIDWAASSGWSRSDLVSSGGGYDMWIWNPSANNYGVCNSYSGMGTNSVTQYIAPMQGFFVRANIGGTLSMDNTVRVHDGAGNWFKNSVANTTLVSVGVQSEADKSSDEVQLQFGYSVNEKGAEKLFSHVPSAPSLYLSAGTEKYSVRYFTDVEDNPTVPVLFKSGQNGSYILTCNFDSDKYNSVFLEDRQMNYLQNMKDKNTYIFLSSDSDDVNRFVLHFGPENISSINKLPARIYTDGHRLVIDLSLVSTETEVFVYDAIGRLLLHKTIQGLTQQELNINASTQILLVQLKNKLGNLSRKLFYKN